jgi:hypothetical protein
MITRDQILDAALKAADWLEANHNRHIAGTLALNSEGRTTDPASGDAQCFCMVGRITKELNTFNDVEAIRHWPEEFTLIVPMNDSTRDYETEPACPIRKGRLSDGKEVIKYVREVVAALRVKPNVR